MYRFFDDDNRKERNRYHIITQCVRTMLVVLHFTQLLSLTNTIYMYIIYNTSDGCRGERFFFFFYPLPFFIRIHTLWRVCVCVSIRFFFVRSQVFEFVEISQRKLFSPYTHPSTLFPAGNCEEFRINALAYTKNTKKKNLHYFI